MNVQQIYKVTTEGDCEGRSVHTLGYCTGEYVDIQNFFKDRKAYSLSIEPLEVINITPEYVERVKKLHEEKQNIEERLKQINLQLK